MDIQQKISNERLEDLKNFKASAKNSINSANRDEWQSMAVEILALRAQLADLAAQEAKFHISLESLDCEWKKNGGHYSWLNYHESDQFNVPLFTRGAARVPFVVKLPKKSELNGRGSICDSFAERRNAVIDQCAEAVKAAGGSVAE